jgi:alpha-glucosidase
MGAYMIFDSPLSMLCDNPSNYKKEQECTDFIAKIPTTFDETVVVAAEVGEYIVMARRKGNDWFIGGLTNWTPRDLALDLSFIPADAYRAELFTDGVNAHRVGIDYKRSEMDFTPGTFQVQVAPGGGFAMRVSGKSDAEK